MLILDRNITECLVRNSIFSLFVIRDGKYIFANQQCADLLEIPAEELIGLNAEVIFDYIKNSSVPIREIQKMYQARLIGDQPVKRYELLMENPTGKKFWVDLIIQNIEYEGKPAIQGTFVDITEYKKAIERQVLTTKIITSLNETGRRIDKIREILFLIKEFSEFEAIAIRLKEGNDYPYYVTSGFPSNFVEAERYLCQTDDAGNPICDSSGNPVLECMCGNVICNNIDPGLPYFTQGGSFWTNSTTHLLATTTEQDRQSKTRNRCNGAGYESVALIPLRSSEQTIGLLQLNDSRKNMFKPETISFYEELGNSIGIALRRKQDEVALKMSKTRFREMVNLLPQTVFEIDYKNYFTFVNRFGFESSGYTQEDIDRGIDVNQLIIPADRERAKKNIAMLLSGKESGGKEYTIRKKDGSTYPATVYSSPIICDNQAVGIRGIAIDITEMKEKENRLKEQNERLQLLSDQLTNIQENDRIFIARQLHDIIGQKLSLAKFNLEKEMIDNSLINNKQFQKISTLISEISDDIRHIISGLHPKTLKDYGLSQAINYYIEEFCRENTEYNYITSENIRRLPDKVEINVYRIFQEAIFNILKHARASKVNISLDIQKDLLTLEVSDDGLGFDLNNISNNGNTQSYGLINMEGRAKMINGTFKIDSKIGEGTSVICKVPLKQEN